LYWSPSKQQKANAITQHSHRHTPFGSGVWSESDHFIGLNSAIAQAVAVK
jgi:hypothetical protein